VIVVVDHLPAQGENRFRCCFDQVLRPADQRPSVVRHGPFQPGQLLTDRRNVGQCAVGYGGQLGDGGHRVTGGVEAVPVVGEGMFQTYQQRRVPVPLTEYSWAAREAYFNARPTTAGSVKSHASNVLLHVRVELAVRTAAMSPRRLINMPLSTSGSNPAQLRISQVSLTDTGLIIQITLRVFLDNRSLTIVEHATQHRQGANPRAGPPCRAESAPANHARGR
jgi:hypothetical protein